MTQERIGRYEVVRHLGAGGLGTVDLARDTVLDRNVALKRVRSSSTTDESRRRLLREGRLAARLDHPHVARILDCVEQDDELVLVLEYLEGETLGARVRREGRLAPGVVASIARDLLDGLEHAHAMGIVHRDVKPDNVMLSRGRDGIVVKLLDFGIAKPDKSIDAEALTESGAAIGTLTYMAPEQATGMPVDARTDVYALGATLYAALAGRPPVRVGSLSDLLASLCQEDAPSLVVEGVDAELSGIVARALARDPGQRWPTAAAMLEAITSWQSTHGSVSEIPAGRSSPAGAAGQTPSGHDDVTKTASEVPQPRRPEALPGPVASRRRITPVVVVGTLAVLALLGFAASRVVGARAPAATTVAPTAGTPSAPNLEVAKDGASVAAAAEKPPAPPFEAPPFEAPPAGDSSVAAVADASAPPRSPTGRASASARDAQPSLRPLVEVNDTELASGGEARLRRALDPCLAEDADLAADGHGRLSLRIDNTGSIADARYLGFDTPASNDLFAAALPRRNRARFDQLGACLRQRAVGLVIAKASAANERHVSVVFRR